MPHDMLDLTVFTFRRAREKAEAQILTILDELVTGTHLDLLNVHVHYLIETRGSDDEPRRRPVSVRIDLAV